MSEKRRQLPPLYNPHGLEQKWYPIWEKGGFFSYKKSYHKEGQPTKTFSMVLPPPNVTGSLHLGHALNHTIQDILARYHRMKGEITLWVPGTDHAGIATQNVVERQLHAQGKSRRDFSRQEFEKLIWRWKEESGGMITQQMRLLGESVDWDYERFTLDEGLSFVVRRVFVRLYQDGLIYRGERMINWCPKDETALSNIEVEYKEVPGKLYFVKYFLENSDDFLLVATTRPETIPGDEAVAVHPSDERYKNFIGRYVIHPLNGKKIPVIADHAVDPQYGTGVVKVTPAHDFLDFEIAERHKLPLTNIFNEKAVLNEKAGPYKGLSREKAREIIVEELRDKGLLTLTKDIRHNVGHSYRSGVAVEPRLSLQWFVKTKPLAQLAIEAVQEGKTQFFPKRWENLYFDWLQKIEDWCISRQLWWGHRIPAFYCQTCAAMHVLEEDPTSCPSCGSSQIKQDEDVLDTWFSSALWPFSTLLGKDKTTVLCQWPNKIPNSKELELFYPTSVLVTGFDIIFFWVARMMMMGLYFMGDVPFRHVYIHGLVRDEKRQKMSKSKGNVVNPLEKMEEYGTDAFRFFLISILPEGKDIVYDESRLKGYQAFCNKIWNTARFIWMNQEESYRPNDEACYELKDADIWILERYNHTQKMATKALDNYRFAEYTQLIYDFFWKDFCDYYVEIAKLFLRDQEQDTVRYVLNRTLENSLKLLHPVMPFITEELYSYWSRPQDDLIIVSSWPTVFSLKEPEAAIKRMELTLKLTAKIRQLRHDLQIPPPTKTKFWLYTQRRIFFKQLPQENSHWSL